jgi:hypothetical protein
MGSKSYSKGISWIDDCRIPFVDTIDLEQTTHQKTKGDKYGNGKGFHKEPIIMQMYKPQGRFPANLLVSDDMLNDGKIDKKGKTKITQVGKGRGVIGNHDGRKTLTQPKEGLMMARTLGDGGSNSRYYDIDKWFDNLIDV